VTVARAKVLIEFRGASCARSWGAMQTTSRMPSRAATTRLQLLVAPKTGNVKRGNER
jgi:hypothetical protein